jgi:hypothetical protein
MNLSCLVKELFDLSGLTSESFCQQLDVSTDDLESWILDDCVKGPGFKYFLIALSVMIKARCKMDEFDRRENSISSASSLIMVLQESTELNEDHKQTLLIINKLIKESSSNQ